MARSTPVRRLDASQLEQLVAGRAPDDSVGLDNLAVFLLELRSVPPPPTADPDFATVLAMEAALGAGEGDELAAAGRARRRRRRAIGIGAAIGLSTLATGGLGAAGALPAPAQRIVAEAGEAVGLDLPKPDHGDSSPDAPGHSGDSERGGAPAGGHGSEASEDAPGATVSEAAHDDSRDDECGTHGQAVSSVARGEESCTPPPGLEHGQAEGTAGAGTNADHAKTAQKPKEANGASGATPAAQAEPGGPAQGGAPDQVPPVPPVPPTHAKASADAHPPAEPDPPSDVRPDQSFHSSNATERPGPPTDG